MPYLLLIIGVLLGLYALYQFFLQANTKEIKAFILAAAALIVGGALFLLAITGRLPAALGLLLALIPFVAAYFRDVQKAQTPPPATTEMSTSEALEVLGLEPGASTADIRKAYKKLMTKVHPDKEGSDWMAAKLNQAKDLLLNNKS